MDLDVNYYRNYISSSGSPSDRIQDLADRYSEQYNEGITKFDILILSDRADIIYKDDIPYKCLIDYGIKPKEDNLTNQNSREVWTKHFDGFKVGDFIQLENKVSKEKEPYLFVSHQETKEGYDLGIVQKCNNILLFYSNESQLLYEIPCIVDNISIGSDESNIITTVDNEVPLTLPNNEATRQIKPNDNYKLGMQNYKIISVGNDISVPGLLIFKMEYSEIEQAFPVFGIQILNGDSASLKNTDTLQLNVQVTNNSIPLSPTPTITYSSSDELVCVVDENGLVSCVSVGNCTITASANGVSDSINIEVVEDDRMNLTYSITSNISPDTEIKVGQTKIFTGHKYNNGIEMDSSLELSVVDDGDSSAYVFTLLSDNMCSIKCNSYTHYITLKLFDPVSGMGIEKVIKLRSLL